MKITVDIPDTLFQQLESAAALRGETLRAFLLRAAEAELHQGKQPKKSRIKLPLKQSKEKAYNISPERISEVFEQEDMYAYREGVDVE